MLKSASSIISFLLITSVFAPAADSLNTRDAAPNLYIDCSSCDMSYIRTEMDYVNYVIDRNDADVFIMITRQSTGSNGYMYTLTLEGRNGFAGMEDTLTYTVDQDMSGDEIRQLTLKHLELGLVRYILQTPLSKNLTVAFKQNKELEQPEDRWNYWVFRTSMNGWFNGQSTYRSLNLYGRLSANRTTEAWKIKMSLSGNYNEDEYIYDAITYNSYSQGQNFYALVVKSISDHFSIGASGGMSSSTYSNLIQSVWFNPTLEYNIFPYSESTRREFSFKYYVGFKRNVYDEITIYDKTREALILEALNMSYEVKKSWGSASVEVNGAHYLHDFSKNRLDLESDLSLKLFKGFSLNIDGRYSMVHDQLSLPRGAASQEEILLHRQELETQYRYWGSMGISYTFGSIYNNIVNPRF